MHGDEGAVDDPQVAEVGGRGEQTRDAAGQLADGTVDGGDTDSEQGGQRPVGQVGAPRHGGQQDPIPKREGMRSSPPPWWWWCEQSGEGVELSPV
jgi:hypothetical protein